MMTGTYLAMRSRAALGLIYDDIALDDPAVILYNVRAEMR